MRKPIGSVMSANTMQPSHIRALPSRVNVAVNAAGGASCLKCEVCVR